MKTKPILALDVTSPSFPYRIETFALKHVQMVKGLELLQKELEEAQRAISELEGDLGTVSFDAEEPYSVEAAIQAVNQLIDGRIGQYASNPFIAPIIDGLKESYREAIILKASEARLQAEEMEN